MFKNLNDSIYNILLNIFNEKDIKNSIIEPLICIIRLSILEFKPAGTKISINNNRITYNDPNILQGAVRWSNGDAREDLHNIFNPIKKAVEWYDLSDENIKTLFKYSIRGLERLKLSYNPNSVINHYIQYYINFLETRLNNHEGNIELDKTDGLEENTIFNKLKDIWNKREIIIINNLILELEENRKNSDNCIDDANTIIDAIETLLLRKEEKVSQLLIQSTTMLK